MFSFSYARKGQCLCVLELKISLKTLNNYTVLDPTGIVEHSDDRL
jgi:hypothetical protein